MFPKDRLSEEGKGARQDVHDILSGERVPAPEAISENALARFQEQYRRLPTSNILVTGHTWEAAKAGLLDPANAEKVQRLAKLQDGGLLYAVMEDGSVEFMDANFVYPPLFFINKETREISMVSDQKDMDLAKACIDARTHRWLSIDEMVNWAKKTGFELFRVDKESRGFFGKEMILAETISPTGYFIDRESRPYERWEPGQATVLEEGWGAAYLNRTDGVRVFRPRELGRYEAFQFISMRRRLNI